METIDNIGDLLEYFDADEPRSLNRRIYNDTDCGARISLYLGDGSRLNNGDPEEWPDAEAIEQIGLDGFTLQTIVEGSDATIDSDVFRLPVPVEQVTNWMAHMEAEAARLFSLANHDRYTVAKDGKPVGVIVMDGGDLIGWELAEGLSEEEQAMLGHFAGFAADNDAEETEIRLGPSGHVYKLTLDQPEP